MNKKVRKSKIVSIFSKISKERKKKLMMDDLRLKKKKRKKINKTSLFIKIVFVILIVLFLSVGGFLIWASTLDIPNIKELESLKMSQATKIYDRTGTVILYNIYEDEKRTIVPLKKISKNIQNATVAIEDKNFYQHDGTQLQGLIRSIIDNVFYGKRLRGASTITQQVVKQTILTPKRDISRKVKELILSMRLEKLREKEYGSKKAAKDSILEMYLNENPYGGTIYGVEEASNFYFGKHASDVTIAEAAYLASMPQAPTTYSPYGKHKDALDKRKDTVLSLMLNQGYINLDEYKAAKNEDVKFVFRKKNSGIKAPHFVMYVRKQLEKMYDPDMLKSGLKVYTTLDYKLQEKVQNIVAENIKEAEDKKLNVSNGGVVVIKPDTGEIISMVGSKDYFAKDIDGKFNVTLARRQPGSTFKPFAYMTAFQNGYTPKTVLWDVKTEFSDACNPDYQYGDWNEEEKKTENVDIIKTKELCYHPDNFDFKFKGHILMEQALPESRNIPAVKTLYLAGLDKTFKNIKLMGIDSLDQPVSHYGLSLVLGAGEVKLLNLTSAYGVFANKGERVKKRSILKIEDYDGNVIYETKKENEKVISKRLALIISRILSDNTLKYPTYGWDSPLYFKDRQVASKTGTTTNNKDFWTMGFDAGNIVLGVWVGNNDNTQAKGKANYYAKKIWKESMVEALKDYPNNDFEKVEEDYSDYKPVLRGVWQGNKIIRLDTNTGELATDETPEEFIKEIPYPDYHSILNWIDKNAPRDAVPEEKDESYKRWEYGVSEWIKDNIDVISGDLNQNIKDLLNISDLNLDQIKNQGENDSSPSENNFTQNMKFKILSPGSGDVFREDEKMYINISTNKDTDIKKYLIYINNKYIISNNNGKINIDLGLVNGLKKENILNVTAVDSSGNKVGKNLLFMII